MTNPRESAKHRVTRRGERPLLRRQLDALADWLTKPHWTTAQTARLLVGVLPSPDGGEKLGPYLPGVQPWPEPLREVWTDKMERSVHEMEALWVSINTQGVTKPAAILALACKREICPPWLDAARGDELCAALPGLSSVIFEIIDADARTGFRKAQAKKRHDQIKNSEIRRLMESTGFQAFRRCQEDKTPDGRSFRGCHSQGGKLQRAKVARNVLDEIEGALAGDMNAKRPSLRTVENYVERWLGQQPSAHL